MKKELATTQTTAITTHTSMDDWGNDNQFSAADLVIAKLLVAQASSPIVANELAKLGDIYMSTTEQVLGSVGKPLFIIPFYVDKVWLTYSITEEKGKKKAKFLRAEKVTPQNESWKWEDLENGQKIERVYVRNVYCLLEGKKDQCFVMPFKITSAKAGQSIMTQMYTTNRLEGISPAGTVFEVGCTKKQSDEGSYYAVLTAKAVKRTSAEDEKAALEWFKMVRQGGLKTDDSDIVEAPSATPAKETSKDF